MKTRKWTGLALGLALVVTLGWAMPGQAHQAPSAQIVDILQAQDNDSLKTIILAENDEGLMQLIVFVDTNKNGKLDPGETILQIIHLVEHLPEP